MKNKLLLLLIIANIIFCLSVKDESILLIYQNLIFVLGVFFGFAFVILNKKLK